MHMSQFNIWFSDDVKYLCFNTSTLGFAEFEKGVYDKLKDVDSETNIAETSLLCDIDKNIIDEMVKGKILLKSKNDDFLSQKKLSYLLSNYSSSKIMSLTLLPTLDCNFQCPYCFENKKSVRMNEAVISKIKEYVKQKIEKAKLDTLVVTWFGGEPLLEYDTIVNLSEYFIEICAEKNIHYNSSMISNCWFLSPEKARKLKELKVTSIQATFDGPRDIHNTKRVLKGRHKETFDVIMSNIVNSASEIPIRVRINFEKAFSDKIDMLFDDISPLKGVKGISIYPAKLHTDTTIACANIESQCLGVKDFSDVYVAFFREAQKRGFPFNWYPNFPIGGCGATNISSTVIQPNGDLCRCWAQVGFDGESYANLLDYENTFNGENFYKWLLFDPFQNKECIECNLIPICMGSCPAKYTRASTDALKPMQNGERCIPEKYNLKEMLLLLYENLANQQPINAR